MIPLADHPIVTGYRQAFTAGVDPAAVDAFVDQLQWDLEAGLADLLLLYRAAPSLDPLRHCLAPAFNEDEGLRLTLARWLQAREPGRVAPVHPQDKGRDCTLIPLHEAVRLCELDLIPEMRRYGQAVLGTPSNSSLAYQRFEAEQKYGELLEKAVKGTLTLAEAGPGLHRSLPLLAARIRRAQKRQALALFPEVTFDLEYAVSEKQIALARGARFVEEALALAGFRIADLPRPPYSEHFDWVTRRYTYTQTLTASELIAPEPVEPTPLVARNRGRRRGVPAQEAFRQIREALDLDQPPQ